MKTLKNVEKLPFFSLLLSIFLCFLYTGKIYAQEGEIDVNIKTDGGGGGELWYNNMWVWVIGIALFIIIIVAIVSAGRKTQ
ncbi:MAG: hypothetical protein ACR2GN_02835 [Bacteroidia bacterium]